MKKIILLSQSVIPGFTIFRSDLIRLLVERGCRVYALAPDYTPATMASVSALGAIPVDYSIQRSGLNVFEDIRDVLKLKRIIKEISPDVILSFFIKPSLYGTLAAFLAGVKRRFAMVEGLGYMYTLNPGKFSSKKLFLRIVHRFLCNLCFPLAHNVFFLNKDDLSEILRYQVLNRDSFELFGPIGVNLSQFHYSPPPSLTPLRFIFVGRLLSEKGIHEFLAAARLVKNKYPDVVFTVIGDIDPENPSSVTQRDLDEFVSSDLIVYPGHVLNVCDWISDSHVFVLPSYREGYPRSTQEAMAVGRAIITTNVPGCKESVEVGVNGLLISKGSYTELADSMTYFIENPDEVVNMGQESRKIATEKFNCDKINSKLINFLLSE